MKTVILVFSLLINFIFLFTQWQRNVVVSVPDGDSLQMADGRRVRLLGLDAPEKGLCMATEAQEALAVAAKGRHMRLKNVVTDDYGRQLANVIIEDLPTWFSYLRQKFIQRIPSDPVPDPYLNRMMVSHGLARYSGSTKSEYYTTLKGALNHAKESKLGIWSVSCRRTSNPECAIKGNIKSGKKVYHFPDCDHYALTIIDTSYGDRWFCTEEEAVKAGFSKASGCAN